MSETPNQKQKTYRTSDLYFAAYLKIAMVKLIGQEREGKRVFFVFEFSDVIPELQQEYFNRIGKVPALNYAEEIKVMKTLTHMVR